MEYGTISNDRDGQIDLQNEEETTKTIIVNILKFSFASSVGCVTIFLIEMINIAYAGGFNDLSVLAGVGLANITVNVVAISVIFGMNGALETFVAQSYGLKDSYLCSVFLNRGRFINTIAFVPIALILYNIESILIRFG
jgi:Na+-driven multidrug efflux pump